MLKKDNNFYTFSLFLFYMRHACASVPPHDIPLFATLENVPEVFNHKLIKDNTLKFKKH